VSIILNALKKSEAQRRLGKTPTLAETAAITNVEEKPRKKTWPWLLLALVIMLSAGWFARDLLPLSGDNAEQVVSSSSDSGSAPVQETPVPVQETQAPAEIDSGEKSLEELTREAREQFYNPKATATDPATASSNTSSFSTPVESYSAPALVQAPADSSAGDSSLSAGESKPAGTGGLSNRKPEPVPERAPVGTQPLSIYEIPREIRRNLPEFKIALQVYAEEPENRFAQVNGVRMFEGNELSSGLVLVEIRKQGLVFTYRDYRFIVGN